MIPCGKSDLLAGYAGDLSLWSISQKSQRTLPARDIAKVLGYLHSKPEQGTRQLESYPDGQLSFFVEQFLPNILLA